MDSGLDDNAPWVNGWLAGKYAQPVPLPSVEAFEEWIDGFEAGCAEVAEHHALERRLGEFVLGRMAEVCAAVAEFVL